MPPLYIGPALPTRTNPFPEIKSDIDLVRDSIMTILLTPLGQRLLEPEFGSRLRDMVFEPNDFGTEKALETIISDAIAQWEPRVSIIGLKVSSNEETIQIDLNLLLKKINLPFMLPLEISRDPLTEF